MPTTAPEISTSSTFTFTGFTGNIISMSWSGVTRAAVNTTYLGTAISAGQTFKAGHLTDWGEVSIVFQFDPAANDFAASPLFEATTAANLTITTPITSGSGGDNWVAPSFLIGLEWDVPEFDSGVLTGTATWKIAGSPTINAGA